MNIDKVKIIEVGPRDGLQNEQVFVPTEAKIEFINLLAEAGFSEIETTSFVNPKTIPQLSDAKEVLNGIKRRPQTAYSCLIPNLKGLKNAFSVPFQKAVFFVAASETFNKKNVNMSIAESFEMFKEMTKVCSDNGWAIRGSISTAFVCPFEGSVEYDNVARVIDNFMELGVKELSLCDTIGIVSPKEVEGLLYYLEKRYSLIDFSLHLHNTKGCAIASVYKGYELGIRTFETSVGGLGGCPNAPGAAGNLATEEVVYLFERTGVKTDIDFEKLLKAAFFIESRLGKFLSSSLLNYHRCIDKREDKR
ncbi:MAG: hydroxymethylglutaryl-CoA lyase [bacterium]